MVSFGIVQRNPRGGSMTDCLQEGLDNFLSDLKPGKDDYLGRVDTV